MISIIAAIGTNRELGKENKLLWQLPSDMKFFRSRTKGHPIIMGRKTHESILEHIGNLLPDRTTIVITRDAEYKAPEGALVARSYAIAVQLAKAAPGSEEVFVCGGASIYSQALNSVDRMYLTHIDDEQSDADAYFPDFNPSAFIVSDIGSYEEQGLHFVIRQYDRKH